jgi:diguanylate cyclase (GGDEF)-like protein
MGSARVVGDVDFFKQINDSFGHEGGDLALVAVGQLIKRELREVDLLARWGGEEFVLLLDETGLAGAIEVTERIRRAIAESFVTHHDREIRCTMSFGLTPLIPGDTLGEAIARADHALYRSKAEGRNRVNAD